MNKADERCTFRLDDDPHLSSRVATGLFEILVSLRTCFLPAAEKFERHVATLRRKRDELVSVLELLLEKGSDPSCRQGSTGPRSEVGGVVTMQVVREEPVRTLMAIFRLLTPCAFLHPQAGRMVPTAPSCPRGGPHPAVVVPASRS